MFWSCLTGWFDAHISYSPFRLQRNQTCHLPLFPAILLCQHLISPLLPQTLRSHPAQHHLQLSRRNRLHIRYYLPSDPLELCVLCDVVLSYKTDSFIEVMVDNICNTVFICLIRSQLHHPHHHQFPSRSLRLSSRQQLLVLHLSLHQ